MIAQAILNSKEFQITFNQQKIYFEVEGLPGINLTGEVKDSFYGLGGATASNRYCYHDQLTDKVNSWLGSFLKSSTEATTGGILITAGLIALTGPASIPTTAALLLIIGGLGLAAHASGLFVDPLNPVNWLDFAATVGSAVFFKAPIGASPFKILTSQFLQKQVKVVYILGGRSCIVKAALGRDAREAIENTVKSGIKGSGISTVIHSLESSPH
ncbi:hypothetical protein DNK57_06740 [Methanothermobacter thermautotrophicus]|uniref:Uncharacterized protein n=1 Tax=Methanothermobacter thermautotrophicus TaxID=145262 RepID=A0A842YND4_METTF|nr:hypothetical protein [Methanothermobacter thermautotrophicus]MBE2900488.1 hypothetical protein [Methanothermobacter thermautotrophicus]